MTTQHFNIWKTTRWWRKLTITVKVSPFVANIPIKNILQEDFIHATPNLPTSHKIIHQRYLQNKLKGFFWITCLIETGQVKHLAPVVQMLEECYPQDKSLSSRQALGKLIVLPNGWNFIRWIALFTFWTTEASYSQGDFTFLCTKENWIKIWLHVPLFLLWCLKATATILSSFW